MPTAGWDSSGLRVQLMRAGLRRPSAPAVYFGLKTLLTILLPILLFLAVLSTGAKEVRIFGVSLGILVAATIGYYLPAVVLHVLISRRQLEIFEALRDALDLMIVSVEAGLALDAAIARVSREISLRSRALSEELHLAELEIRAGATGDHDANGTWLISASHKLSLGMPGMHGTYYANRSIQEADLLVAVGMRFDDRVTGKISAFAPNAKIGHIDIVPTSIRKNVRVDVPIVGDVKKVLATMNKVLKDEVKEQWHEVRKAWLKQIDLWKAERPMSYDKDTDTIKPQYVVEKLYELSKGEAIVTTEVGQNQMWAAQYYHFARPRSFLSSGGLGTMGYGLPAAIGAQVAFPDRLVIDVAGDGSIQMNIQELITAVNNCLPIKVAILNNQYLGMVRQWQELFYDRCYSATGLHGSPDFVKLAEAYGALGLRAVVPRRHRLAGPVN